MWQIYIKQKNYKKWEVEKFQTGGEVILDYKEAQRIKKKLSKMSSSFDYKVKRVHA